MDKSIVEYFAEQEHCRCGYCKQPDKSCSHGMWAHILTVDDYQNLIDRGWRRSGKYCYKPMMNLTCCPLYTIRCDILDFKLSKSQKKLMKRFNKFLSNDMSKADLEMKNKAITDKKGDANYSGQSNESIEQNEIDMFDALRNKSHMIIDVENVKKNTVHGNIQKDISQSSINESDDEPACSKQTDEIPTIIKIKGPDPNKQPCKKAKQIRIARKQEKLRLKGMELSCEKKTTHPPEGKLIEDIIKDLSDSAKNRLQIKLVRTNPPSKEWEATASQTHSLYVSYQVTIHGDAQSECTVKKFERFLVESPLKAKFSDDGISSGYGSFHQQYWLDGNLIAVGVIDILPKCVSSVYFFYDPKFSLLTLGTYGALREVAFTKQLNSIIPQLKHYYMGFYIHSCPKMRYKGNYYPSFLLCPETYTWHNIEGCREMLERMPYARLNPDLFAVDSNDCTVEDLDDVCILVGDTYMRYNTFKLRSARDSSKSKKRSTSDIDESVMLQYANLVGKISSHSMLLVKV